jgi:hypothetical protein
MEGMLAAHSKLEASIRLLHQTNWAAAPACLELLGDVDRWVCGLYNKAEASLKARLGLPIADPPGESKPEAAAELARDQEPQAGD